MHLSRWLVVAAFLVAFTGCSAFASEDDGLVSTWGRDETEVLSDEPPIPALEIDLTSRTVSGWEFGFEPLDVTVSMFTTPCAEAGASASSETSHTISVSQGAQPGMFDDVPLADDTRCVRTTTDQDLPWADVEFDVPTEGACAASSTTDLVTGSIVGMGALDVHAFTDGSAGPQRVIAERSARTDADGTFSITLEQIVAGPPDGQPVSADSERLEGDLDIIPTDEIGVVVDTASRYSRIRLWCEVS